MGSILTDFYEYNPDDNTWSQIADYPDQGVYFATGFSAGGKGYVCGGKRGPDNYTPKLYEYKPTTNSWAERAQFPGGVRYQMISFSVSNFAYIGMGADEDIYRKDWWKYNPGSNEWTQLGDFYGGERAAAVTFTLNNKGFIAMGTDGGYEEDVWEYSEEFDTWTLREKFPGKGRKFASSFTIGDTAYVGIGKAYDGGKRSFNKYYPAYIENINELKLEKFDIYPNPIKSIFKINTDVEYTSIEIRSVDFKLIENHQKSEKYFLKNELEKSIYFLILKDELENAIGIKKVCVE